MTTPVYADNPHIDVELALAEARRQGATKATITLDAGKENITIADNRNGEACYIQGFNNKLHPSKGSPWQTEFRLREHITPHGLDAELVSNHPRGAARSEQLMALHHHSHQRLTPSGSHTVLLAEIKRPRPTAMVLPDGRSRQVRDLAHEYRRINRTINREPGTEVLDTYITITAVANQSNTTPADHAEIQATAATLALDYIKEQAARTEGYVWPSDDLADHLGSHNPQEPPMPKAPSVAEYNITTAHGGTKSITVLTPANAVLCDYDSVQKDLLDYAMSHHAPRKVKPVRTKDPTVPVIRLLSVQVTDLDGTVHNYPVQLWDGITQRGRYDNRPEPQGDRIPHSRVGTVQSIQLTMEIRKGENTPDVFTFNCDAYNDQDAQHHLLLITQDRSITREQLERIAYLHNPRTEDMHPDTRRALYMDAEDWRSKYLIDNLLHGPVEAAKSALQSIAATTEALSMSDTDTGTPQTIDALSPQGKVHITLNPVIRGSFDLPEPPVPFARMDPGAFVDAKALIVPTNDAPGAISAGHALRYSSYDGKLETFQPGLKDWRGRVHPLTATPAPCRSLEEIKAAADTVWVVAGSGPRHLVLVPAPQTPKPRADST